MNNFFPLADHESGYQSLSNLEVQFNPPHVRETSGSTLLNPEETISHDHPVRQTTFQRTNISSELPAPRLSSESGNGEAAWQTLVDIMETRHENDVADLKEDHALMVAGLNEEIARLQSELTVTNRKWAKTQKRFKGLLQGYTDLKAEVNTSKEALQQVTSASQALQVQYDELKEKHDNSLVHNNAIQLPLSQSGQQAINAECSLPEHQSLEQDLNQSRWALHAMAVDLNKALDENRLRSGEIYQLKRALEEHPEHDIGLAKVIEYKDKMLQDLQATAGKCSMDLDKLQKQSSEDKDLARDEISSLNAQLARKSSLISWLRSSVNDYQVVSEDILGMLQKKAYPNDLIQAMDSYFQVATNDNRILAAGSMRQEKQIEEMYGEISKLQADLLQAKRSSDEKDDLCKHVQQDLREQEAKMGSLEMELERLQHDLQQAVEEKEGSVAEAKRRMAVMADNLEKVMDGTVDECARMYIRLKEQDADRIAARYQQVCQENYELRQIAEDRQQQTDLDKCCAYFYGVDFDNAQARLEDAEKDIMALREENQRLTNLPHVVHVSKVLKDQEELQKAQEKIHRLEQVIKGEEWKQGNCDRKTAAEYILQLKLIGFQLLLQIDRLNKANIVGAKGDEYGAVKEYIDHYQFLIEAIPSCDEEAENDVHELEEREEAHQPEVPGNGEAQQPEVPGNEEAKGSEEWNGSFF